jgi:hypothetical protein
MSAHEPSLRGAQRRSNLVDQTLHPDKAPTYIRVLIVMIALLLSLPLSGPASAQTETPAQEAQAEALHLMTILHYTVNATKILDGLRDSLIQLILQRNPRQTQEQVTKTVTKILVPGLEAHVDELTNAITHLWAMHFSAEELRSLEAFYSQPLVQKLIAEQPQIAIESFKIGTAWGRRVGTEVMREHVEELRKRGLNI